MSLATKDVAMWLVDVQARFIFNIEETQMRYKENVDAH
jgi:hypothetical protein